MILSLEPYHLQSDEAQCPHSPTAYTDQNPGPSQRRRACQAGAF